MRNLHRLITLLVLLCIANPLSAYIPQKSTDAYALIDAKELVVAFDMNEEPLSFNIHKSTNINSAQLFTAIAEGLVSYNPVTLSPAPGTAASIIQSDDKLQWTVKIRADARFSNGDKITAKTYRDSWMNLIDPNTPGDLSNLLDMVKGVKDYRTGKDTNPEHVGIRLIDLQTLTLDLNAPSPYLLDILCHHSFAAMHPANLKNQRILSSDTFVSSGAFRIKEMNDKEILLEQNPYYWDRASIKLETLRIEFKETSIALLSEFSEGLVHWSETYLPIPMLLNQEDVTVFPEYSTSFFYFSATEGPFADPEVRRALALMIPWDTVREESASIYTTDTLVPQDIKYHGTSGFEEKNTEEALAILKKVGYPNGEGLPTMNIAIYPNAKLEKMTDIITDIWSEELGMMIIIDVIPFSLYIENPEDSPYAMAYITWIGDFYDPYSFLSLWTSNSGFNPSRYHNPDYDQLIEDALNQNTDAKRYEVFKQAEQQLLDTAVVIPIAHGVSVNFIDAEQVSGWYPNLLNIHPFKYMGLNHTDSVTKSY